MLHTQITCIKTFRIGALFATGFLAVIFVLFLFPSASMDDTKAANTLSETTLSMTTENINLAMDVTDPNGTFAASTPAEFTVTTNNYSGYTLSIGAKENNADNSKLINGEYAFNSISSASSQSDFTNGTWGYKPSKINSTANVDYLPAPSYAGDTLDTTNTANNEANSYSITLAAKVDYSLPAGGYSNTFVITATANPVGYQVTYDANTEDTVTNMPSAQTGNVTATDVVLSNDVPVRAGYNFTAWHDDVLNIDYQPGDTINLTQTGVNDITLKATWEESVSKSAKAVLGANNNLNFVYDSDEYTVGDTYTDNIGETEIVAVYDVPVNSDDYNMPQWVENYNIQTANFDTSFYSFKPTSTSYWFYGENGLMTITNADNLNTSEVTNMSSMFEGVGNDWVDENTTLVIDGIEEWDVSNVTDMSSMFYSAGQYARINMDLSGWNTESVTDLHSMFYYTSSTDYEGGSYFNIGDIGGWDVSKVADMGSMFYYAGAFASTWYIGDLSGWEVGNVENMYSMFDGAANAANVFDIGDLSGWDTGKVKNMYAMFAWVGGRYVDDFDLGDIGNWNVSNVEDMSSMFRSAGCNASTWYIGDLGYVDDDHPGWNVSSVKNMSMMFSEAGVLANTFSIGDLSSWDTGNVKDMSFMFRYAGRNAESFDLGNLDDWDVSKVTNMYYMFYDAGYFSSYWNIGDISNWTVSQVTNHGNFIRLHSNNNNVFVVNHQPGGWT